MALAAGLVVFVAVPSLPSGPERLGQAISLSARCPASAPVREYRVAAINIEITLNRFLDYDPEGRMFVLEEDLARARGEEARNREARSGWADPAVSAGLQGDAIQPLVLRVNQGDCLRVALRNDLQNGEPVSIHIHEAALYLASTGVLATAGNEDAIARPGVSVTYEWMVSPDEPEGTHTLHSLGHERLQSSHGLFGAVVVETRGSAHLDPRTGTEPASGWDAVIRPSAASAFREFVLIYHEIGNELFQARDRYGSLIPLVDHYTSSYKPAGRAINYRSEPFMNRLRLQEERFGVVDLSNAYSSYTFGDPGVLIARSYVGEPVKWRIVHGGSEVFHVHHVHGGAIRWLKQPGAEETRFDVGFDKRPPLLTKASTRIDSQAIGPSEAYDAESECGSGGCQQSVGDFLIHCHVAHHYLAGMWGIWRVYNTLQDGPSSTDDLPPLRPLPGRAHEPAPAVTSAGLVGRIVDWKGASFTIRESDVAQWVERLLPPPGQPVGYDASVLDWRREGLLYLNEPESAERWANFQASVPGLRRPILFDPATGKLAYPLLRPHLGARPPFAPSHAASPFLDPVGWETGPPEPGQNGPRSLCPAGTRLRSFDVQAITLPIVLNQRANLIDPVGQLYVLKEDEDAIRADPELRVPLVIRANAGEDCVDVVLKSELEDNADNRNLSKANMHIHFVQFDVQGSDGVNTGFNYEQSVRPFQVAGDKLTEAARPGDAAISLASTVRYHPGVLVGVGMDQTGTFEVRRIAAVEQARLVFDEPLEQPHGEGEYVSAEFVRYRWYPDVQFGTAYFHDHVHATSSWRHGLFGALIAEPPGATYHHPETGTELRSGPLADIRTASVVSPDIRGSFRELVMFIQDDNPVTRVGRSSGSSLNLRVEPLASRSGDPSMLFSSRAHGDPATPVLRAYAGDPLVIRTLVAATNDVHTWHSDGQWFRREAFSLDSQPTTTLHVGISERFDLMIPRAGGSLGLPGDYLYYNGRSFKLREGSWGIIRVLPGDAEARLHRLPGREAVAQAPAALCPADAPVKAFSVAAVEAPLPMLDGGLGRVYVLEADKSALLSGAKPPEPLVLHVNVGDCVQVRLRNELLSGRVSFHADRLAYDPNQSQGIAVGSSTDQSVAPGEERLYTFYAHPEQGEGGALVRDWGDVLTNPGLGLYGAIIVGPKGSTYTDPSTGMDLSLKAAWSVDVHPPGASSYRDFGLFLQDEDPLIGTQVMPYTDRVEGLVGLNYRSEPLRRRLAQDPDTATLFNCAIRGDPQTPLLRAFAGDPVRIHVFVPFSEQSQVFAVEGHRWPLEPAMKGADLVSALHLGALEAVDIALADGAGGPALAPGDYVYGDHRGPFMEAGLWGVFRIFPPGDERAGLRALATTQGN